ncbi:hypothetical protein DM01DRAFT_1409550 [Hesseltinella vesiculosa]|uniref:Uncharacterized protein n=1 Tax=Hesseltinella vesiculosa TaxID=101127 RepID=A0A1X2GA81_9FUNG|nr:hypothetical protein DM01DRAFT_1409550 [Hesseltinella vesiculosa]
MGYKMLWDNPQRGIWHKPLPRTNDTDTYQRRVECLDWEGSGVLIEGERVAMHGVAWVFSGAILFDGQTSLMINTVEPYGRDVHDDAHFERRSDDQPPSYPANRGPYGHIQVITLNTADCKKLVIGTRTCHLLVACSMRLDLNSVNVGPRTTHFIPGVGTKIFLCDEAIRSAKDILGNDQTIRSQTMPAMYQLKQVRSKFNRLSTYSMPCLIHVLLSNGNATRHDLDTVRSGYEQQTAHHGKKGVEALP